MPLGNRNFITMGISEEPQSAVRGYLRKRPVLFDPAVGSFLHHANDRAYLDFSARVGGRSHGHNNPVLKRALLDYPPGDRVIHSLDMSTVAKRAFLTALDQPILPPQWRGYRVRLPAPGGACAVEAAPKSVRKFTGRTRVMTCTNSFHGATLGPGVCRLEVTPLELRRRGHPPAPRCQPRCCTNGSRRRTPQLGAPVSGALTIARLPSRLYIK